MFTAFTRIIPTVIVVVIGVALLASSFTASAHGKELAITVSTHVPDQLDPLRRLYRIEAVYSGDLDTVEGAKVTVSGIRSEGGESLAPVRLQELDGQPGVYIAEIVFTRFGVWNLLVDVEAELAQGEGSVSFTESVTPAVLSESDRVSLLTEAERVRRLQVFFSFEWWPDIVTLLVRILHTASAVMYAGIVGAVLLAAWIGGTASHVISGRLGENFLVLATVSLTGILLSGLYSAAFDAPNAAPGIYEYLDLIALPYGEAYLAAFLLKPIGWIAMVYFTLRVDNEVVKPALFAVPAGASTNAIDVIDSRASLRKLIRAGVVLTAVAVADLAVVIYLHYLSHLGVFLPEG
jgi:hypothetical protein